MSKVTTVWNGWAYWEVETLDNGQMGNIRYVVPEPMPMPEIKLPRKRVDKKKYRQPDPDFVPGKFRNLIRLT